MPQAFICRIKYTFNYLPCPGWKKCRENASKFLTSILSAFLSTNNIAAEAFICYFIFYILYFIFYIVFVEKQNTRQIEGNRHKPSEHGFWGCCVWAWIKNTTHFLSKFYKIMHIIRGYTWWIRYDIYDIGVGPCFLSQIISASNSSGDLRFQDIINIIFLSEKKTQDPPKFKMLIFKLTRLPCCGYSKLVSWNACHSWNGINLIRSLSTQKLSKMWYFC